MGPASSIAAAGATSRRRRLLIVLASILVTFGLAFGGLTVSAPSAAADSTTEGAYCDTWPAACGWIQASAKNKRSLPVADSWRPDLKAPNPGTSKLLKPGKKSTVYFFDVDAWFLPAKCRAQITDTTGPNKHKYTKSRLKKKAGKWYKKSDPRKLEIKLQKRNKKGKKPKWVPC